MPNDPNQQLLQRIERLERERNRGGDIQEMMQDAEPPFSTEILAEEFPEDFKMPTLKQYDGEGNPVSHLTTFQTWMSIRRASSSIKCQAFPLTLTDIAYDWFQSLKPGSISSYEQLKEEFLARFATARTRKKDVSYLWTVKQGKTESLKKYLDRYIKSASKVEGLTESEAVTNLREGLQDGELLKSAVRKAPKTLAEFIARAQEFVNEEEYFQSRKEFHGEIKRRSDDPEEKIEVKKARTEDKAIRNNPRPLLAEKFQNYTPLNTSREQILMQIEGRNMLTPPEPMRGDPNKRDRSKFCRFHNDHGHLTTECIQLKKQIEVLIQKGELAEFVDRVIEDHRRAQQPTSNNNPAGPAGQQNLREIRTIVGGPATGDTVRERKSYAREVRGAVGNHYINMTEHVSKMAKIESTEITFTEEEARTVRHPHNDALVVSLKVANNLVHRILVDNGSSVDVLFKGALDKMNLDGAKLRPVKTPLYGFTGERVDVEGLITLPVTMDEVPRQVIRMIDFLVVDQ